MRELPCFNHLPALRIEGPRLLRGDTGAPIQIKGMALFYRKARPGAPSGMLEMVRRHFLENERLGLASNLVRLSYFSSEIDGQELEGVAHTAQFLAERGAYLALTPHNMQLDAQGHYLPVPDLFDFSLPKNYFLPIEEDAQALGRIAQRLLGFHHVLFGVWNEPSGVSWPAWSRRMGPMIAAVYQHHPDPAHRPLMIIPGLNWARDFRGASIPLPQNSFLLDLHEYPSPWVADIRNQYVAVLGRVPLLISEMGGTTAHAYATQSEGDVAHIHRVLWEVVNGPQVRGLVHYTTWKGDDSLDGVRDPKGGLSPRGRVFLEERQAFPSQSDFR